MIDIRWFEDYFQLYSSIISSDANEKLMELKERMLKAVKNNRKIIVVGNGGSAAMAGHCAVDFSKNAGIRTISFNSADLITCLANDYGHAQWMAKALEIYGDSGDVVIIISSSGKSENVINAALKAKEMNIFVVTFTGFDRQNPLRQAGQLNFWVDSRAYNIVENSHQIWLLAVCDAIIGKVEYPAS